MVGVAQLVEHLVVVQVAAGSSPVTHPTGRPRPARRPGPPLTRGRAAVHRGPDRAHWLHSMDRFRAARARSRPRREAVMRPSQCAPRSRPPWSHCSGLDARSARVPQHRTRRRHQRPRPRAPAQRRGCGPAARGLAGPPLRRPRPNRAPRPRPRPPAPTAITTPTPTEARPPPPPPAPRPRPAPLPTRRRRRTLTQGVPGRSAYRCCSASAPCWPGRRRGLAPGGLGTQAPLGLGPGGRANPGPAGSPRNSSRRWPTRPPRFTSSWATGRQPNRRWTSCRPTLLDWPARPPTTVAQPASRPDVHRERPGPILGCLVAVPRRG